MFISGVSLCHTVHSVTASPSESLRGVFAFQGCVGAVLFTILSGCNESGADGGAKAHPGTCLLWVPWLLDGALSSGHVSGNPCNRLEGGVVVSGGGMLLGGPRSVLLPPASVVASNGKSGVGSIPLICVWGAREECRYPGSCPSPYHWSFFALSKSVQECISFPTSRARRRDCEVNCSQSFIGRYYVVYCSIPRRFYEVGKTFDAYVCPCSRPWDSW